MLLLELEENYLLELKGLDLTFSIKADFEFYTYLLSHNLDDVV